jgi:ABC-type lipoprotein release transport system permease subunit
MFRYALKRVVRSYRLFIALTIGVLLATSFFASTNVAADILSKDAMNASVEGILYDFVVESPFSNWSISDIDDLENEILDLSGIVDTTHSSQFTVEFNNTGVNMTLAGISQLSDLASDLQLISGTTLGENETYIVSGSTNESLFYLGQEIEIRIPVLRAFPDPPYFIERNLTVAGLVSLSDSSRNAILAKPILGGGMFGFIGALAGFGQDTSYNLMLTDWNQTVESIIEEADTVDSRTRISMRNLIHIQAERSALLDPYDVSASIARVSEVGSVISSRSTEYEGDVISYLVSPLTIYQFIQLGMSAQFLSLSLPIFLLSYFTGTMVSDAGYNFRRREIGLLLTKGYERGRIKRIFLVEGALVGSIAGAVSVFLGTAAAYIVLEVPGFNIVEGILSNMVSVVLAIILGMFLGLLSVWRPAGRASKLEIIDSLKQYVFVEETAEYKKLLPTVSLILGTYKLIVWLLGIEMSSLLGAFSFSNFVISIAIVAWLAVDGILNTVGPLLFLYGATKVFMRGSLRFQEFVVKAGRRFFGAFGNLATRNVKRNPSRTASLVFIAALIVSFGIFTTGSLFTQYDNIDRTARYDVGSDIRLQLDTGANMTELLPIVSDYSEITGVTPEYHLDLRAGTNTINARGIRPDEWADVAFWEEEWFLGDLDEMLNDLGEDGIILSVDIARTLELETGDTFFVEGPFGSGIFELRIVGLIGYQSIAEVAFAGFDFGTGGDYTSYVSESFLNSSMLLMTSTANILATTTADTNGTLLQEQLALEVANVFATYSVTTEIYDYQTSPLESGRTKIQWLAITFAVILAMVGTGLVVILTLSEKDAEIALLSVRGFSKWQLFKTLLAEVLVTVLFALILGVGVGFIEIIGQLSSLNDSVTGLIRYRLALGGTATLTMMILMGVVLLATIVPVWWSSRRPESKVDILRA